MGGVTALIWLTSGLISRSIAPECDPRTSTIEARDYTPRWIGAHNASHVNTSCSDHNTAQIYTEVHNYDLQVSILDELRINASHLRFHGE
jgi:hypothetical protein